MFHQEAEKALCREKKRVTGIVNSSGFLFIPLQLNGYKHGFISFDWVR